MSLALCAAVVALKPDVCRAQKDALNASIEKRDAECWDAALQIWKWAEPGYQEKNSSVLLASMLEKAGLRIKSGVAGIPTAFTATAGNEKPVIGILGEFDALPGLSQNAVPHREPGKEQSNGYGHGCGHHLFGVASASATIAIAEQIAAGKISGTVRFYGCPAEEGGSAKVFMTAAGLFDDCDAVLHWHPAAINSAGDRSSLARMAARFRFRGKAAHAAGSATQGRSALDAVELTNHASELLREHVPDGTRIHHVITDGGAAPNVVPETAEVYFYVRHPQAKPLRDVYKRLLLCAQAGALATETKLEVNYQGGVREILPNRTLAEVAMLNLKALNKLAYSTDELQFAVRLQESFDKPEPLDSIKTVTDRSGEIGKGSTDVGDVSWKVPTTGFTTACWVPGTPAHSWQAVACGGTSIAHNGMTLATKVLAATAWDLYSHPETLAQAKAEHQQKLDQESYESLMEPGQKPPLDYRNVNSTVSE